MRKASTTDRSTHQVEKVLLNQYHSRHPESQITVYRYNSAAIRVRDIDPVFEGKGIIEREVEILPIIRSLDDRLQDQITMLLLLSPKESERSLLSAEFDDPQPSRL